MTFTRTKSLTGELVVAMASGVLFAAVANATDSPITSCQEITASGTYELREDITQADYADCIVVKSDDVTLKLNGYAIHAAPGFAGISADSVSSLKVKGPGRIQDAGLAVYFTNVRDGKVT